VMRLRVMVVTRIFVFI